jgi:hypothetical protein
MTWKTQVTKVQLYRLKRKKFLKSVSKLQTKWKHSALRPTSTECQMQAANTMLMTYSWTSLSSLQRRELISSWRGLLIEYPMLSKVPWVQMSWLMYSRTISKCLVTKIPQLGHKPAAYSWQIELTKNNSTAKNTAFRVWNFILRSSIGLQFLWSSNLGLQIEQR